ncbi:hypothetical protein ACFPYM_05145 [Methylobacterium hispanicum]|uniref:hypothetical protein n=1 Tax=Methylobacterium hispanicum TaxID=270350 RepID=UPI001EDD1BD9|nr:hypothetical protein [Methylobacterium hispanicum]
MATFDGIARDGSDVRIRTAVSVRIPIDPGAELPSVARYAAVGRRLPDFEDDYLGFDGGCYFPAWYACQRSLGGEYHTGNAGAALYLASAAGILPSEDALQQKPHHRITGRQIRGQDVLQPAERIEECSWLVDLPSLRPSIEEVRAAAARLILRQGEGARGRTFVRTPLPVWTQPRYETESRPVLRLPTTDDLHGTVTAFGHDRLEEALAFARLPSVRGRRDLAPPSGRIEVEPGWAAEDDLVWIARVVGAHWIRDLDPVVPRLSAAGVAAWHLGANANGVVAAEGRKGAEAVLSGLLRLRDEVEGDPALAAFRFVANKSRELADRLVHIEGMVTPSALPPRPHPR